MLKATGGERAYDIGTEESQTNGGSLTIQNNATVIMMRGGTNALKHYITGKLEGNTAAVDAAGKMTIAHAGEVVITVTNPGDDNYLPVFHTVSLTINKAAQKAALTYSLPKSVAYGDAPFSLAVSGGNAPGDFMRFEVRGTA